VARLTDLADIRWGRAEELDPGALETASDPVEEARFEPLPSTGGLDAGTIAAWSRELKEHLYRERPLRLFRCRELGLTSGPGEDEGTFRARIRHAVHEHRDREISGLRERYGRKLDQLRRRKRTAEERVTREEGQYDQQKYGAVLDAGAGLLGALFGGSRRTGVGGATRTARKLGRAAQKQSDVRLARERLEVVRSEIENLERALEGEVQALGARWDAEALELEPVEVAPRKSDVGIERMVLAWVPFAHEGDGRRTPLHRSG
jgi:hypothetical protein